jgi:hypothetical protein
VVVEHLQVLVHRVVQAVAAEVTEQLVTQVVAEQVVKALQVALV